jgi:hypothetical protein
MNKQEFFDQYKDPRWQKKRLKIMERDEFACQSCLNTERTLNVHHKYYIPDRKPWDYPDRLLVTLCQECHEYEEECKYIISDFTKVLLSDGYLSHDLVELLEWLRKLPMNLSLTCLMSTVRDYETLPMNKDHSSMMNQLVRHIMGQDIIQQENNLTNKNNGT